MNKTMICILCPNGCELSIEYDNKQISSVQGNQCPKGAAYAEQEISNPVRNIATSIRVIGGELPLCSVRLTRPIPKERIFEAVKEIQSSHIKAPVTTGQIVIQDLLGLDCDVIATREIERL